MNDRERQVRGILRKLCSSSHPSRSGLEPRRYRGKPAAWGYDNASPGRYGHAIELMRSGMYPDPVVWAEVHARLNAGAWLARELGIVKRAWEITDQDLRILEQAFADGSLDHVWKPLDEDETS